MNAGISEDHKLLVRTAVGEKFTFERVANELVNQHPRAAGALPSRPLPIALFYGLRRAARRVLTGSRIRGWPSSPTQSTRWQRTSTTVRRSPEDYPTAHVGYSAQFVDDGAVLVDQNEAGACAEEHLAFLSEQGLGAKGAPGLEATSL